MAERVTFILDDYVGHSREDYVMDRIGAILWAVRQGEVAVWHSDPWNVLKRYRYKKWLKEKMREWALRQSDTTLIEYLLQLPSNCWMELKIPPSDPQHQKQCDRLLHKWIRECMLDSYRQIRWLYQRPVQPCQQCLAYTLGRDCSKK